MRNIRAALGFALLVLMCWPAHAQETGINGRVSDPSNAVVAGVKITASGESGSKFSTVTSNNGLYQFPTLRAEPYVLRFEYPGFAPAERTLTLLVGPGDQRRREPASR